MSWELTETLLALGVAPVGLSLPGWYTRTIAEPPLPAGVTDIGLLYQPNFEVLQQLAPDLMIVTPGHASLRGALQHLAPTLTLGAYMSDPQPYRCLCTETRELARALSRDARAATLIDTTAQTIAAETAKLDAQPGLRAAPVIVAEAVDDRYLRVYGAGSLFDHLLQAMRVSNAAHPDAGAHVAPSASTASASWNTNSAGFALVPVQRLIEVAQAGILLVGPVQPEVRAGLARNPLWRALPAVRNRRVVELPVIAPYGGLVSMQRFARAVTVALTQIAMGSARRA
ncbi:ABC transporter substrate-binding protein [Paraburkholderia sp. D15]|uniref:ABC transporter substrate-binding protein n=1 Tax=Paraburkholderia sp. D15 TaxID=2880218 RepID=UPI0024797EB3|nr:ABC transporter substrate-binding protein [Paraburkholderia sp. D15]WGS52778.1 ABC transporter substrate-binding protein [Paraburkholderia sp. D15]